MKGCPAATYELCNLFASTNCVIKHSIINDYDLSIEISGVNGEDKTCFYTPSFQNNQEDRKRRMEIIEHIVESIEAGDIINSKYIFLSSLLGNCSRWKILSK